MALNPFFNNQNAVFEQGLVQDLINEHIKMHGVEVYYIPRKYIKTDNIIREVHSSSFTNSYPIEAYISTFDGYNPSSDLLSKFGLQLKYEVTLVISRERFDTYIAPRLQELIDSGDPDDGQLLFSHRPKEGDLMFFPLGDRLFEIKRVEFEDPFYQLGDNYIYELQCELFEYEDEVIETGIKELQDKLEDQGYVTTLTLVSSGSTATAEAFIAASGLINQILLTNDGFAYTSAPTVTIDPPPIGGSQATAYVQTSALSGAFRKLERVVISNAGFGYTTVPKVFLTGGGGLDAAAVASIGNSGVYFVNVTDGGSNYVNTPTVTITAPVGGGTTALAAARVSAAGTISDISLINVGAGYTVAPTVTISSETVTGFGTFIDGEIVIGQTSGTEARVRTWINVTPESEKTLKVYVNDGQFVPGEIVIGTESSAIYTIKDYDTYSRNDKYNQNDDFEEGGLNIIDFSETNPFGEF